MVENFKDFIKGTILEEIHKELKAAFSSKVPGKSKQESISDTIKDLHTRGEDTGIEKHMPQGSARAYASLTSSEPIHLDNKPSLIRTGTKVAIRAKLDRHHDKKKYGGLSLGQLQNKAENDNEKVNEKYRIIKPHPNGKKGHFVSNSEHGIFPPLIDHDKENHHWSHVGHAKDISHDDFKNLTKSEEYPEGISHEHFVGALERDHHRQTGSYHIKSDEHEKNLDHAEKHPLTKKFLKYHNDTKTAPLDYRQVGNFGVFHHPDGPKHIVLRDRGFDRTSADAYLDARHRKKEKELGLV